MEKLSKVIVLKLTEVAKEKGFNPHERGRLKDLARKHFERVGYQNEDEKEIEKELNKLYRSLKNFFLSDMQYTSDTLDTVLQVLGVEDVLFKHSTIK